MHNVDSLSLSLRPSSRQPSTPVNTTCGGPLTSYCSRRSSSLLRSCRPMTSPCSSVISSPTYERRRRQRRSRAAHCCTTCTFSIRLPAGNSKKLVPYSITSVGHGADLSFLVVSPQVTLVTNPVVGCRYFPPGQQLLFQPNRSPAPPLTGTKLYCLVTEAHGCK